MQKLLRYTTRNEKAGSKHKSLIDYLTGDNKLPDPSSPSASSPGFSETTSLCIDSCKGPFEVAEVGGLCTTDSELSDTPPLQDCALSLVLSLLGDSLGLP